MSLLVLISSAVFVFCLVFSYILSIYFLQHGLKSNSTEIE